MRFFHWLLSILFPEKCTLCGRILEKDEHDLCHKCRIEAPQCPVLTDKYPFISRWTAVWYYEDVVRKSLLRFKFSRRRHYARVYGQMLAMKLMEHNRLDFDVVTWIPVSRKRLRKRGYDQVKLIADALCAELNLAPTPLLKKVRNNPPQSRIVGQAERRANVLGAYEVQNLEQVRGKRILLLDDIITTGATAGECARVLLTAGATEVQLAVVAAARKHKK